MLLDKIEVWYEKKGRHYGRIAIAIIFLYIFFKYILRLVAPFVLAWIFAMVLNPVVTFLKKRFGLPRGVGTLVSMLTVLTGIFALLGAIIRQLWQQMIAFAKAFPLYQIQIEEFLNIIEDKILEISEILPIPEAFTSLDGALTGLLDYLEGLFKELPSHAYDIVSKLPGGIIFFITMLIAIFFMVKDYEEIKAFIRAQIPIRFKQKMGILQSGLKSALGGYIKTQLILMCFTFMISFIGLLILRRDYALLISLGIGFVDALPVFGSGAVLIPWGIYTLVMGNYGVGVGLLSVYLLIVVMRQIMEPKVLSTQIGVYALITLMSIYIGLQTVGPLGIILGPIVVVSLQTLQKVGILPSFKKPKEYSEQEHSEEKDRKRQEIRDEKKSKMKRNTQLK
jgi:sporulation integral membrane protein YtvI